MSDDDFTKELRHVARHLVHELETSMVHIWPSLQEKIDAMNRLIWPPGSEPADPWVRSTSAKDEP